MIKAMMSTGSQCEHCGKMATGVNPVIQFSSRTAKIWCHKICMIHLLQQFDRDNGLVPTGRKG